MYIYVKSYIMARTNVVIDDELLQKVFDLTDIKTKREAVDQGLRELVRRAAMHRLLDMRGKVEFWPGYLEEMKKPRWTKE